jgi:hypothetical protein
MSEDGRNPGDYSRETFEKYIKDGFKPFVREVSGTKYIVLRKSDKAQVGFGRYSDERWDEINEWYKDIKNELLTYTDDELKAAREEPEPTKAKAEGEPEPDIEVEESGYATVEELRSKYGIDQAVVDALLRRNLISDIRREERDGRPVYVFNPREIRDALERPIVKAAIDAERRLVEETKESVKKELEASIEELRGSLDRIVEERLTKRPYKPVRVGEMSISVPASVMAGTKVKLPPNILLYYSYINNLWVKKMGKPMSLEEFVSRVLKEHLEECLGLYTALGREITVFVEGGGEEGGGE